MPDISRHPIIKQAYDLCRMVDELNNESTDEGFSDAVIAAGDLLIAVEALVINRDGTSLGKLRREKIEADIRCKRAQAEAQEHEATIPHGQTIMAIPIGTKVELSPARVGTITAFSVRERGVATYQVVWWDGATRHEEWLETMEFEVMCSPQRTVIGFLSPNN